MTATEQGGLRADARRSTARILEAAQKVLAEDPSASLERIAEAAGLARATVHRRFASRQALLDALVQDLTDRYLSIIKEVRVRTAPPLIVLHRATEITLRLKYSHPFVTSLTPTHESPGAPASHPRIVEELEVLFSRLHAAGHITTPDPAWGRRVYLALLNEIHHLPATSFSLSLDDDADVDDQVDARVTLLITTLLGALGGTTPHREGEAPLDRHIRIGPAQP
ncbi:TetR/AcrR family transcriptional regulator [Umezawaea endophytica]|uniref:TetR/AcrR family transcriptional regulator n=1 Tax=Umezawaea endophytica TaxID=1654476 RepID=A0A9X3AEP5_9PSEU|nr:TetR/AcrR family transcriptional regulator [Umezawaea endophytica]MCS7477136.1 TetR/AcrR family transcriptional regulator [Umezawaea endophytica]